MALDAWHLFMHSPERILGLVMIKFGNWPDGPPTCGGVTILTGYGKGAVRTTGGHTLREGGRNRSQLPDYQQKPNPSFDHSKRNGPFPQSSLSDGGSSAGLTLIFPNERRRNNCTEGQLMAMFSVYLTFLIATRYPAGPRCDWYICSSASCSGAVI
jgi:hypothetical protein